MKKLLIITLLSAGAGIAQTKPKFLPNGNLELPKKQITPVFLGLENGRLCEQEVIQLKQSVFELSDQLLKIQSVYNAAQDTIADLESQKRGILDEAHKLEVEAAVLRSKPKRKWVSIGLGAQMGYDTQIRITPGISVHVPLIQF